jgi:uncharacterized protein YjbI with pentapeptide repeats
MAGEKYDQEFFLALAAKGKDAWNAWRRDPANKDVRVTFAGVDFSQAPRDEINFEGFEFGNDADFSKCMWRGPTFEDILKNPKGSVGTRFACFSFATFGDQANFSNAAFFGHRGPSFFATTFGDSANFAGVNFSAGASFGLAVFSGSVRFAHTIFGAYGGASFRCSDFRSFADFGGAIFSNACFNGAAFRSVAFFQQTHFKGRAEFAGMSKEEWTGYLASYLATLESAGIDERARTALKRQHENSWGPWGGPDRFQGISCGAARFDGEAIFSGRSFKKIADFTNTRFYFPPNFDNVTGANGIDFTGARIGFVPKGKFIHLTEDSGVLVRLRTFRKVVEETKNHDLERDLYVEERKAERGVYWRWPRNAAHFFSNIVWMFVMLFYWAFANYGRSVALPFAWLVVSGLVFYYWGYPAVLAPVMPQSGTLDAAKYEHAVRMLALGNAVPFVGPLTIDAKVKDFLFCPSANTDCLPIPSEGYQFLVLGQNLLSIILVFFIGLALRNYFKIK